MKTCQTSAINVAIVLALSRILSNNPKTKMIFRWPQSIAKSPHSSWRSNNFVARIVTVPVRLDQMDQRQILQQLLEYINIILSMNTIILKLMKHTRKGSLFSNLNRNTDKLRYSILESISYLVETLSTKQVWFFTS